MHKLQIKRYRDRFAGDESRVVTKFFSPGSDAQSQGLADRILALPKAGRKRMLQSVLEDFGTRHRDLPAILNANFERMRSIVELPDKLTKDQKLLLGAYFSCEYSIESAALFNPSIVAHPDQDGVASGSLRFIMSLRATGEGHVSSIVFRGGVLDDRNRIALDPVSPYVERPRIETNITYDRHTFLLKLGEIDAVDFFTQDVLGHLPDQFTLQQLREEILREEREYPTSLVLRESMDVIDWIAESNYTARFRAKSKLSERVLFPALSHERKGMEDARFVRFIDTNDEVSYYATYTAYDGHTILPMLLRTEDFTSFEVRTLNGPVIRDKDLALFPRRVNGKYMMVSRQDGENMYIMSSDNIDFWHEAKVLQRPEFEWELVQIGNCGSPIETEAGWLLLTHGVGPMRKYCITVTLLDLEDPSQVIGQLAQPLIVPRERERDGYVPNVVYSCGALVNAGSLIIPYAMSDTSSGIATVPLDSLLEALTNHSDTPQRGA